MSQVRRREFSTDVRIILITETGVTLSVAELGHDYIVIRNACEMPPSHALLEIFVDDYREFEKVFLPEGISPGRLEIKYL
jgi:hypothetical protein